VHLICILQHLCICYCIRVSFRGRTIGCSAACFPDSWLCASLLNLLLLFRTLTEHVKIRMPGPAASQVAPAQPPPAQAPPHIPPQPKAPQAPPQQAPPQQNNLAQIWPLLIKKLADSNQLDQVASDITRLLQAGADSEKVSPSICKVLSSRECVAASQMLRDTAGAFRPSCQNSPFNEFVVCTQGRLTWESPSFVEASSILHRGPHFFYTFTARQRSPLELIAFQLVQSFKDFQQAFVNVVFDKELVLRQQSVVPYMYLVPR
jgi:hypothetical protein